jgi:hypothetical protein
MKMNGYSKYEIYPETGMVFSYKTNSYIGKETQGYIRVTLTSDEGKQKVWQLHRLIWTAVNGEIPDDMEINHMDENPMNNSIANLNMLSHRDNVNWGTGNDKRRKTAINNVKQSKPIIASQDGVIKMYFPSTQEAQRNGFRQEEISKCCNGKRLTHKGYSWLFLDTYLSDWWDKEYMN